MMTMRNTSLRMNEMMSSKKNITMTPMTGELTAEMMKRTMNT